MKVRNRDVDVLREQAWKTFIAAHAAAKTDKEMGQAWTSYTGTLAAIGPAKGRVDGPKLPPRVEAARADAYYRKLSEEVYRQAQGNERALDREDS
jgi:hypothetical protein